MPTPSQETHGQETQGHDEFAMLSENATEAGLDRSGLPEVRRLSMNGMSALKWGVGDPKVVFLHGGAQNAHTWDTVILALGQPALAIDLPGHGRSAWRQDHDYSPPQLAAAVAPLVQSLAPKAELVAGMSLGGLAAISLAATTDLVRRLAMIDVTPGANAEKAKAIFAFTGGPASFPNFDEILRRTIEHNPSRSLRSLERGVRHNARELPDGTWTWRYDPVRNWSGGAMIPDFVDLWDAVSAIHCPVLLVRGGASPVVDDADVSEFFRRQPRARIEVVAGAGHSVQGDRPVELAQLLNAYLKEA
jgi:pimeloyl-ACP methyl ester carboxylesterase